MKHSFFFVPFALLFSVGCSASPGDDGAGGAAQRGPDEVFAVAPGGAVDGNEVTGVWETVEPTRVGRLESRIRFELRADHLIAAARCTTSDGAEDAVVAGERVSGNVSADSIAVGKSIEATKPIGGIGVCGVRVAAGALPRCTETEPSKRKGCFAIADGTLTLHQGSGAVTFTKIAD